MKHLSKQSLLLITLILLAVTVVLAVGFLAVQKEKPASISIPEDIENQENQEENEENITETVDTSDWQTYRSEEYGFEFKLSEEYTLPENEINIVGEQDDINILNPNKDVYTFNSKKGLEIVKEVAGLGDAVDYWMVKVSVHEYSDQFTNNFKQWIFDTFDANETDVQEIGFIDINGEDVPYFCWVSFLGDDCGVYLTNKQSIVEIKAWDKALGNEKINLNYTILSTFSYW